MTIDETYDETYKPIELQDLVLQTKDTVTWWWSYERSCDRTKFTYARPIKIYCIQI